MSVFFPPAVAQSLSDVHPRPATGGRQWLRGMEGVLLMRQRSLVLALVLSLLVSVSAPAVLAAAPLDGAGLQAKPPSVVDAVLMQLRLWMGGIWPGSGSPANVAGQSRRSSGGASGHNVCSLDPNGSQRCGGAVSRPPAGAAAPQNICGLDPNGNQHCSDAGIQPPSGQVSGH